jgi:OmpA family
MKKSILYVILLFTLLGASFYLPKVVQNTPEFTPLAEQMGKEMESAHTKHLNKVAEDAASRLAEESARQAPEGTPSPSIVADAPSTASDPAAAVSTPMATTSVPEVLAPVDLAALMPVVPVAEVKKEADLTPFVTAMATGDLAKAAALLDLMKADLAEAKFKELSEGVEIARKREATLAAAAAAPATTNPAAAVAAAPSEADKAMAATQAMLVESLRQMQESQRETNKIIATLKDTKVAPAATGAAMPTATGSAAVASNVPSSGPMPGGVTVKFGLDPKTKAELRGFADSRGGTAYNLGLSGARAQSVKDALRRRGIDDVRISVVPFGSFQASSVANDADSRKVEVLIVR